MAELHHCSCCGMETSADSFVGGSCPHCLLRLGLLDSDGESKALASIPAVIDDHFEIRRILGRGGMAEVFLARDKRLGRDVAVKMLPVEFSQDPGRRARLKREALAVAALNHANICTVHDIVESADQIFVVMEYVEGSSLESAQLSVDQVLKVVGEILDGLEAAHSKGIIHRDLKPSNLMITPSGHVKIMDFGLAKMSHPVAGTSVSSRVDETGLTKAGQIMGTPSYMSPEQVRGTPLDHRSDLFAVGVILYEMVAGNRPFRGDTPAEIVSSILRDRPVPVEIRSPAIATALQAVINKALEKRPEDRYQNASEFRDDLRRAGKAERASFLTAGKKLRWSALGLSLMFVIWLLWSFELPDSLKSVQAPAPHELLIERANLLSGKFSQTDNEQAIRLLEEAIRLVPESSQAHADMALAKLKRYWWYQRDSELMDGALASAVQALNFEPGRPDSRVVKAIAHTLTSPAAESYLELARCLREEPFQPEAAGWLIYSFYAKAGRFEAAETLLPRLDREESRTYHSLLSIFLNVQKGDFKKASEGIRRLELRLPDSDAGAFLRTQAAIRAGNVAMLESSLRSYQIISPDKPTAVVLGAYLQAKRDGQASELSTFSDTLEVDYELAALYAQSLAVLGKDEDALFWLERSVDRGNYNIILLGHEDFQQLSARPRFQALYRSLELRIRQLVEQLDSVGFLSD